MHKIASLNEIKTALQTYHETAFACESTTQHDKSAAVLLLFVEDKSGVSVVFIERAHNPADIHSGQVAFPGGRAEDQDSDAVATAIRETAEEIGVHVNRDDILALLPLRISRKQYEVRPVIACINWPQPLVLQTEEVASVFTMPLAWLADKSSLDSAAAMGLPEGATIVYKEYNSRRLWGLTAHIIDDVLKIISTHLS